MLALGTGRRIEEKIFLLPWAASGVAKEPGKVGKWAKNVQGHMGPIPTEEEALMGGVRKDPQKWAF